MSTYQAKKNMAREEAIEWQEYAAKQSMSYERLLLHSSTLNSSDGAMAY